MLSSVVLVSNFFSGLHMPCVKQQPSLRFFRIGLVLFLVYLNFRATSPFNYTLN